MKIDFCELKENPKFLFILLFFLVAIGFVLRFNNLPNYSFWIDEVTSIQAAAGVIDHGSPIMPEDYIYYKSPLYIYSLAGSISAFGLNEWSARILSVIYGTLTIILIFIVSKKISNDNKTVGLAAALIYVFSLWAIGWAREARFYQQFQFFSLLTIYLFWLGFFETKIKNTDKYKYFSILAFLAAALSSKLAIILIVPLIITLIFIKGFKKLFERSTFITLVIIGILWIIHQAVPIIFSLETKNPAFETDKIGLGLQLISSNLIGLGGVLLANIIMCILAFIGIGFKQWRGTSSFWFLYSYLIIIPLIIIVAVDEEIFRGRYLYFIYPVLIITAVISSFHISGFLSNKLVKDKIQNEKNSAFQNPVTIRSIILIIILISVLVIDADIGYSYKISTESYSLNQPGQGLIPEHPDFEKSCEVIAGSYQQGDCVLARRYRPIDFYLNEYLKNGNYEYRVFSITDINITDLHDYFDNYRIWVVLDAPEEGLVPRYFSESVYDYLIENTNGTFKSDDGFTEVRLERS